MRTPWEMKKIILKFFTLNWIRYIKFYIFPYLKKNYEFFFLTNLRLFMLTELSSQLGADSHIVDP